jgi:hypothetical protein
VPDTETAELTSYCAYARRGNLTHQRQPQVAPTSQTAGGLDPWLLLSSSQVRKPHAAQLATAQQVVGHGTYAADWVPRMMRHPPSRSARRDFSRKCGPFCEVPAAVISARTNSSAACERCRAGHRSRLPYASLERNGCDLEV